MISISLLLASMAPQVTNPAPTTVDLFGIESTSRSVSAVGNGWKSYFDETGVVFTPALGPDAPVNESLAFTFEGAGRRSGLEALADLRVAPERVGDRVEFMRSESLRERYAVDGSGFEQSFLFEERPDGDGDLVVRGRIATSLQRPLNGRFDEGMELRASLGGGVALGGVTGIDAEGRMAPGWLELDGDELRMVLPDDFVDQATFPLLLDPAWSGLDILPALFGGQQRNPDTTWCRTSDKFAVVYEQWYSQSSADVLLYFTTEDGIPIGTLKNLSSEEAPSAKIARQPQVFDLPDQERLVVTWVEDLTVFGPTGLLGRTFSHLTGTLNSSTQELVSFGMFSGEYSLEDTHDMGGDLFSVALHQEAMDGSDRTTSVMRYTSDPMTGALAGPGVTTVMDVIDLTDEIPLEVGVQLVCSQESEFNRHCLLIETVWVDRVELRLLVRGLGGLNETSETLVRTIEGASWSVDPHAIMVDGNVAITYQVPESENPAILDVELCLVECVEVPVNEDLTAWSFDLEYDDAGSVTGLDERMPRLVRIEDELVQFYGRQWDETGASGSGVLDMIYRSLLVEDFAAFPWGLAEPEQKAAGGGFWFGSASMSSQSDGDKALIAYTRDTLTFPAESTLCVSGFEAEGAGGPVIDLGGGCGDGGQITLNGVAALGTDDFTVELGGLPPVSQVSILNITLPDTAFSCGLCSVAPWLVTFVTPVVGGGASWDLAVPHSPSLFEQSLLLQTTTFFSSTQNCTLLPNTSWSNQLVVTFGL